LYLYTFLLKVYKPRMKAYDDFEDYDNEGNILEDKELDRRKFLRDKSLQLIRLTLYNNRNKIS